MTGSTGCLNLPGCGDPGVQAGPTHPLSAANLRQKVVSPLQVFAFSEGAGAFMPLKPFLKR
jgi:hypothetical protein